MKPADQLGLLYDAWALGQSGYAPVTSYLDLARSIPSTPIPWSGVRLSPRWSPLTEFMETIPGHAAFAAFARDRLHPLADRLGWDAQANEEPNAATLRQAVLVALSRFGDQPVIAEARRRFDRSAKSA